MKAVCVAVAHGNPSKMPPLLRTLFPGPLDPTPADMAYAFETLPTDQHLADYDTITPIGLGTAQASYDSAAGDRGVAGDTSH